MIPDYHIHTVLCKHAKGDISEFQKVARTKKLTEICFTDHMPAPDGYDAEHRMLITEFPQYKNMVQSLPQDEAQPVLFGIEADYYEGCPSFLETWLPSQEFDIVLGSIHFIKNWGFDNINQRQIWDSVNVPKTWQIYFKLLIELAKTGLYDVVAHLDLPKKFGYRPSDKAVQEMAQPALDQIAASGMVIEVNTSGLRKPIKEIYPSPLLLKLAQEREIPICFGSDAHQPEEVGFGFPAAIELAKQVGYTHAVQFTRREKRFYPIP